MSINEKMVESLQHKFEMASYLISLSKNPLAVFKKEMTPPKSVEKEFLQEFGSWIESMVKKSVGQPEATTETPGPVSQFTPYEVQVIRGIIHKIAPGAGKTAEDANARGRQAKTKAVQPVAQPAKRAISGQMYLIDNSSQTDPEVEANEKVMVVMDNNNGTAQVALAKNPRKIITTNYDNLSKEPIL